METLPDNFTWRFTAPYFFSKLERRTSVIKGVHIVYQGLVS